MPPNSREADLKRPRLRDSRRGDGRALGHWEVTAFVASGVEGGKGNHRADRSHAPSNGEVEGPDDHVSQARRARNFDWVPPRPTTHASRPPPTIVRGRLHDTPTYTHSAVLPSHGFEPF